MPPILTAVEPLAMTFPLGLMPFIVLTVLVLVGFVSILSVALADRRATMTRGAQPTGCVRPVTDRARERSLAA